MNTPIDIDSVVRLLADFRRYPRASDREIIYALDFHLIHEFLWRDQAPTLETPDDSLPEIVEAIFREEEAHPEVSPAIIPVLETVKELTPDLVQYLKQHPAEVDKLSWDVFEKLIAEFLASWGFEEVSLVGRNPRTAADIFAAKALSPAGPTIRVFVEVKHGGDRIGVEVIDRVYGAMVSERPKIG